MARLAGVSQATVSRALAPGPNVPDGDPRSASNGRRRRCGYVPSRLGRSLVTRATGRIAMVADLGNPLFSTLLTPVHDALSELGYQTLLFAEHQDRVEDLLRALRPFGRRRHPLDRPRRLGRCPSSWNGMDFRSST